MTTIAFKDGNLATDTLITKGFSRVGYTRKSRLISDGPLEGCVAAMSGDLFLMSLCFEWLEAGGGFEDAPDALKSDEAMYSLVLIHPAGGVTHFEKCMPIRALERGLGPKGCAFAMGSGEDFALGAMEMGASAEQAVKVAMALDAMTGGDVILYTSDGESFAESVVAGNSSHY